MCGDLFPGQAFLFLGFPDQRDDIGRRGVHGCGGVAEVGCLDPLERGLCQVEGAPAPPSDRLSRGKSVICHLLSVIPVQLSVIS